MRQLSRENPTSTKMPVKYDVLVKNLCKSYGKTPILQNLNMHVEQGIVYGLLGCSGCGKTTLLSCIMNLKSWDSGEIFVFGKRVDGRTEVGGKNIGYMPQDVALYDELTVEEMMKFFSTLHGMSHENFKERKTFLQNLVNLPEIHGRQVKTLSGGMKRRASLLLTLIHNPKLLILDEPTVGLDPLLRERIWNYLYNLTIANQTTIIITTHYIEEVKRANKIGLMRKTRLILEEDPAVLMRSHNTVILDQAVRQICYKDELTIRTSKPVPVEMENNSNSNFPISKKQRMSTLNPVRLVKVTRTDSVKAILPLPLELESVNVLSNSDSRFPDKKGLQSLASGLSEFMVRSFAYSKVLWIWFSRHPAFLLGVICLAPIQLFTTGWVVGVEPKFVPIGVINDDVRNWENLCGERELEAGNLTVDGQSKCRPSMLSCDYIKHLAAGNFIKPIAFQEEKEAMQAVKRGQAKGYVRIPNNFSENMLERALVFRFAEEEVLDGTTIQIKLDMADYVTWFVVVTQIYQAFSSFIQEAIHVCDFDFMFAKLPFHYRDPVYGALNVSAQDYVLSAIIPELLFEISFCLVPLTYILDMKAGTMERSKVAGLRFIEFMMGLVLTLGSLAFLQGVVCYIALEYGLNFQVKGNILVYLILCFLAVLSGGTMGLFFGVLSKDEMTVIILEIFILPIVLVNVGILQPEEILPGPYKSLAYYCLPTAAIMKSFRFVMNRGVGIFHGQVWPGLLITLGWSALFTLLSLLVIVRTKRS